MEREKRIRYRIKPAKLGSSIRSNRHRYFGGRVRRAGSEKRDYKRAIKGQWQLERNMNET